MCILTPRRPHYTIVIIYTERDACAPFGPGRNDKFLRHVIEREDSTATATHRTYMVCTHAHAHARAQSHKYVRTHVSRGRFVVVVVVVGSVALGVVAIVCPRICGRARARACAYNDYYYRTLACGRGAVFFRSLPPGAPHTCRRHTCDGLPGLLHWRMQFVCVLRRGATG